METRNHTQLRIFSERFTSEVLSEYRRQLKKWCLNASQPVLEIVPIFLMKVIDEKLERRSCTKLSYVFDKKFVNISIYAIMEAKLYELGYVREFEGFCKEYLMRLFNSELIPNVISSPEIEVIQKLFPLLGLDFRNQADKRLFNTVTTLGVLKGESIVYTLVDFFPLKEIKNIDIFVKSDLTCSRDFIVNLFKSLFPDAEIEIVTLENKFSGVYRTTIKREGLIQINVFLPRDDYPGLDLDYVKCEFHRGRIRIEEEASKEHETRIVMASPTEMEYGEEYVLWYSQEGLYNLHKKGFKILDKTPLFKESKEQKLSEKFSKFMSSLMSFLTPLGESPNNSWIYSLDYTNIILQHSPTDVRDVNLLLADFCNGEEFSYFSSYYDDIEDRRLEKFYEYMEHFKSKIIKDCGGPYYSTEENIYHEFFDILCKFPELFKIPHVFIDMLKADLKCIIHPGNVEFNHYLSIIFGEKCFKSPTDLICISTWMNHK